MKPEAIEARIKAAEEIIEASKITMANLYGLPRNEKFEKAWKIAWDQGHSSGIGEVEAYFGELAELIKP